MALTSLVPERPDKFRTLTCLGGRQGTDPLLDEIQREVQQTSVLEVMKSYIDELHGVMDNNARAFKKVARLFEVGTTPERVEGHHDGVAIGLRTGDEQGLVAEYGNIVGLLWSGAVGPVAPWVGKSFNKVDAAELERYTDGTERGETPTCLGINHFNRLDDSIVNRLTFSLLTVWMHLKEISQQEREMYGHDRDGGLFIARKAPSVYAGTPREVFQLNYRWRNLGNAPPFTFLIDELVQIADGCYLGQLLFSTRRWLEHFDPAVPVPDYHYQHFGYFLLMNDSWAAETRRVFHHIEQGRVTTGEPTAITGTTARPAAIPISLRPAKFTTFTFADPRDGNTNDALIREIQQEAGKHDTILDLLKYYSTQLLDSFDNNSPYFLKLHELFNRGMGPDTVRGYYRGALISFHTEGYYKLFNVNTLDVAWKLGRFFTPWTGKTFEDLTPQRLSELTDGVEKGEIPTFWGTNTLAMRTAKQKFIGQLMRLAHVRMEDVPEEESLANGYDVKTFFFVAHKANSIIDANKGKKVFQFNYRWPNLKTFPPDNYCIDELVMIADGLYLGQLIYATELLKKYDPHEPPSSYKYRLFGYFLLMDEEWNSRRKQIGFDPHNA